MREGLCGFSLPAVDDDAAGVWSPVRLPALAETTGDELGQVVELVFQNFPECDVVEETGHRKDQH